MSTCEVCKTEYTKTNPRQRYCSPACNTYMFNTLSKLPEEMITEARHCVSEDDFRSWVLRWGYDAKNAFNFKMITNPKLQVYIGVEYLHFFKLQFPNLGDKEGFLAWAYNRTPRYCLHCGVATKFRINNTESDFDQYCSSKCYTDSMRTGGAAREAIKESTIRNIGVDNPFKSKKIQKQIKQTMLSKYGVEHSMQIPGCIEKVKDTLERNTGFRAVLLNPESRLKAEEKWGGSSPFSNPETRNKKIETFKRLYGGWPMMDPVVRQKSSETVMKRFGVRTFLLTPECAELNRRGCIEKYGVPYIMQNKEMWGHIVSFNSSGVSRQETEIADFVRSLGLEVRTSVNDLIGGNKQIDIFIPEKKVAIEFNGCYWHSEANKHMNYHLEKTEACEKSGIHLIQIWEDEWKDKPDIVKKMLSHKLGARDGGKVYARHCSVDIVTKEISDSFMDANHIQGSGPSSLRLGLYHNSQLVSVAAFIESATGTFILNRFATSVHVIGGAGKLLRALETETDVKEIISFGDRSIVNRSNNIYLSLGFEEVSVSAPDYKYTTGRADRMHKFGWRKEKFKSLGYDIENKTERELAAEHGLLRVYNSGLIKYRKLLRGDSK